MNLNLERAKTIINNLIVEIVHAFDTQEELEYYLRVEVGVTEDELKELNEEFEILDILPRKENAAI